MWGLYALVVHLLLLGSIFVIYFRSPVIEGLRPQVPLKAAGLEAPANRLVLIVTDGLRADSFFEHNCNHVADLREIFIREGLVGISRTRVPTESRPGHIALIAGLYEDPSAVTRGWKENPIEFDTVFNRSGHTYAWGAQDILHIFEKLADGGRPMLFDAYNHDLDFSGQHKTYKLDDWVFKRVHLLLQRKQKELRAAKEVVFFMHLLGLDTAGHVHKPGTPLFLENLNFTQHGIWEMYQYFEKVFPDKRTAYLLTSDHGMTDSGSHGAGAPHETDTPFVLWGAGITHNGPPADRTFVANDKGTRLPLHELEQAQLTPLMSALIGLPPPMNNFGVLPLGYINASANYEAHAAHSNALQLLEQFRKLAQDHKRGLFAKYMNGFKALGHLEIEIYERQAKELLERGKYQESLTSSGMVMKLALDGIDYYHGYYRNALLFSTTATFVGWILYLYQLLAVDKTLYSSAPAKDDASADTAMLTIGIAVAILIIFILLQGVSLSIGLYLLLPLFIWLLPIRQRVHNINAHKTVRFASKTQLLVLIACAELLVFTFFERRLISLCFVAFACYSNWGKFKTNTLQYYVWLLLIICLSGFPLLPPSVGYQNMYLMIAGILIILLRAFVLCRHRYSWHTKFCNISILLITAACVFLHTNQMGVPLPLQLAAWLYLIYAFVSILLSKDTSLESRLAHIFFNLGTLYTLLCTSYESLFVHLLAIELMLSLATQEAQEEAAPQRKQLQTSFRLAFTILLYTFFSLFGSGNIASISSFDPNIARCFLSHFAPFVIMGLVLLKLILPVVLNMSIIYTYCDYVRQHERQFFICLLLICDIMGLNFLFMVRNSGSWLEIGSSISHFVIMEITTLVLLLLAYLAKLLLKLTTIKKIKSKA
ncbi:GPI ethanolamine phosphate transferase 1 [Scaptodrosophila lebanonensis]|uniref:GPI ethanolamine phosphate transferase 1 n=1 Tax=Drosophila lebanonensis TaxID=7225 RepID=A0A6J2TUN9_DROLE|nr:GPI ethanolamine phosphate transferase 1 [Scaptodrosophila lebanonensis]